MSFKLADIKLTDDDRMNKSTFKSRTEQNQDLSLYSILSSKFMGDSQSLSNNL